MKFCKGSWIWQECSWVKQEKPEEGQRIHQPKHCVYNNKDVDNILNTLNNMNYQASSEKSRQTIVISLRKQDYIPKLVFSSFVGIVME